MRESLTTIVAVAATSGIAFSLALGACAGSSTKDNAATAATYEAEQLACVEKATTLEQSHACRCEVMQRYQRSCPAGWAKDGGGP